MGERVGACLPVGHEDRQFDRSPARDDGLGGRHEVAGRVCGHDLEGPRLGGVAVGEGEARGGHRQREVEQQERGKVVEVGGYCLGLFGGACSGEGEGEGGLSVVERHRGGRGRQEGADERAGGWAEHKSDASSRRSEAKPCETHRGVPC